MSDQEKELAEVKKQLEIIRSVSSELNKMIGLKAKLDNILEILDEQFGIDHSRILMPNENAKVLSSIASRGYPENSASIPFGKGIAGLAAEKHKPINITGLKRKMHYMAVANNNPNEDFSELSGLKDAESQIAIPLISNNELIAVLMAESLESSVFSKADETFLLTLTTSIAASIQNSILFDSMEEKIRIRTAELEQISRAKDKLFSIISHDLRSPVTSFQSITQLLKFYTNRGEFHKIESLSDKIDGSVSRLNFLLDNLLNWSLNQGSQITCHFEKIPLESFIREISALYEDILTGKEISLSFSLHADDHLFADRNTLSVIFRNLLSNAVKFTPRNGTIHISSFKKDQKVCIEVSDSGTGMTPEKLKSIFTFSDRKSTIGTEKERGTGLGLILVYEFVQLNNGEINVESTPGKGTKFSVLLPGYLRIKEIGSRVEGFK